MSELREIGGPAKELKRVRVDQAKLPQYLRYKGQPLIKVLERMEDGDLIDLKAYFDAESSIVYEELMRRALSREGKDYPNNPFDDGESQ